MPQPVTLGPDSNPDQRDLCQDVQEGATAEPADPEVAESMEADDPSGAELTSTVTRKYPLRNRQPPKTLTYDALGQPSTTSRW